MLDDSDNGGDAVNWWDEEHDPSDVFNKDKQLSSLYAPKTAYAIQRAHQWPPPASPVSSYTLKYDKMKKDAWPWDEKKVFHVERFVKMMHKMRDEELAVMNDHERIPNVYMTPFYLTAISTHVTIQRRDPIPAVFMHYLVACVSSNIFITENNGRTQRRNWAMSIIERITSNASYKLDRQWMQGLLIIDIWRTHLATTKRILQAQERKKENHNDAHEIKQRKEKKERQNESNNNDDHDGEDAPVHKQKQPQQHQRSEPRSLVLVNSQFCKLIQACFDLVKLQESCRPTWKASMWHTHIIPSIFRDFTYLQFFLTDFRELVDQLDVVKKELYKPLLDDLSSIKIAWSKLPYEAPSFKVDAVWPPLSLREQDVMAKEMKRKRAPMNASSLTGKRGSNAPNASSTSHAKGNALTVRTKIGERKSLIGSTKDRDDKRKDKEKDQNKPRLQYGSVDARCCSKKVCEVVLDLTHLRFEYMDRLKMPFIVHPQFVETHLFAVKERLDNFVGPNNLNKTQTDNERRILGSYVLAASAQLVCEHRECPVVYETMASMVKHWSKEVLSQVLTGGYLVHYMHAASKYLSKTDDHGECTKTWFGYILQWIAASIPDGETLFPSIWFAPKRLYSHLWDPVIRECTLHMKDPVGKFISASLERAVTGLSCIGGLRCIVAKVNKTAAENKTASKTGAEKAAKASSESKEVTKQNVAIESKVSIRCEGLSKPLVISQAQFDSVPKHWLLQTQDAEQMAALHKYKPLLFNELVHS